MMAFGTGGLTEAIALITSDERPLLHHVFALRDIDVNDVWFQKV